MPIESESVLSVITRNEMSPMNTVTGQPHARIALGAWSAARRPTISASVPASRIRVGVHVLLKLTTNSPIPRNGQNRTASSRRLET